MMRVRSSVALTAFTDEHALAVVIETRVDMNILVAIPTEVPVERGEGMAMALRATDSRLVQCRVVVGGGGQNVAWQSR